MQVGRELREVVDDGVRLGAAAAGAATSWSVGMVSASCRRRRRRRRRAPP